MSSSLSRNGEPDIHGYFLAYSVDSIYRGLWSKSFNFKPEIINYMGRAKGQDSFNQFLSLGKPSGTGTLTLKSKDPFAQPMLDPKYFQNDKDTQVIVEGMQIFK